MRSNESMEAILPAPYDNAGDDTLKSKKQDLLSIAVFLVICYALMFVFGPLGYVADEGVDYGAYQLVYVLAAFSPCIACLVTRLIFREGFQYAPSVIMLTGWNIVAV